MKNNYTAILALSFVAFAALGCSWMNPFSGGSNGSGGGASSGNKTVTDKAVDTVTGESKIGIPECDEVLDMITAEANNPDDNFVAKAAKNLVFNRIKDGIRDAVKQNTKSKEEMAKLCRDFKQELLKTKSEQAK
ncbi:MAG: hypothetical protein IPM50_04055 [Acidobacteriota bacterium]|nr:MAG: hypothetical protein IPM50_04055 [Acidobacteriota bacterium]